MNDHAAAEFVKRLVGQIVADVKPVTERAALGNRAGALRSLTGQPAAVRKWAFGAPAARSRTQELAELLDKHSRGDACETLRDLLQKGPVHLNKSVTARPAELIHMNRHDLPPNHALRNYPGEVFSLPISIADKEGQRDEVIYILLQKHDYGKRCMALICLPPGVPQPVEVLAALHNKLTQSGKVDFAFLLRSVENLSPDDPLYSATATQVERLVKACDWPDPKQFAGYATADPRPDHLPEAGLPPSTVSPVQRNIVQYADALGLLEPGHPARGISKQLITQVMENPKSLRPSQPGAAPALVIQRCAYMATLKPQYLT